MPVLSTNVRIRLEVEDEDVHFTFPAYHQIKNEIRKLLKNRFVQDGRGGTKNLSYEARQHFFDINCKSCEGLYADEEEQIPISSETSMDILRENFPDSKVEKWTDLIPEQWKAEVSSQFEEMSVKARTKAEGE